MERMRERLDLGLDDVLQLPVHVGVDGDPKCREWNQGRGPCVVVTVTAYELEQA